MAFEFMNFNVNEDVVPANPPPVKAAPAARPYVPRATQPLGVSPMDFASFGPMAQTAVLNDMASGVNNFIGDEMDSRVLQAREARRMQHEKELMMMRMQMMKSQNDGDIIRSLLNG